jgi:sensor histidine kinase YesM
MNPHFIFNSLSAIQNFIFSEDSYQAGIYLKQFSELIRMILHFSTRDYITLEEESHFLHTYLQLQKLRFNKRFDFEVIIDPELRKEQVLVPPMLAQPFIENAVEHGIFYKSNNGFLSVRINARNNTLVYEIEDDGIGLAESQKINQQIRPQHRSMAITITRERIESINASFPSDQKVKVIDRKQLDPGLEGVYVEFSIPYLSV